MDRRSVKIGEFLYHATRRHVGSDSSGLKRPSFKKPFFVTDNSRMVEDYVNDDGSIYVFKCDTRKLIQKSWWFEDPKCMSDLKGLFPKTTKLLKSEKNGTFFDTILKLDSNIEFIFWDSTKLSKDEAEKLDDDERMFLESMVELNLVKFNQKKNVYVPDAGLLADDDLKVRRLIKSKIFEGLYKLGYRAIMDRDTTGQGFRGYEFGIFDLSLLGMAWSVSIEPESQSALRRVKKAMSGDPK